MRWTDEMRVDTPEQIGLDFELAGLGSRLVAAFVDGVLKVLLGFVVGTLGLVLVALLTTASPFDGSPTLVVALIAGFFTALSLGYGVYFEARWNGQTPGKWFAHVRVVRLGGGPVDATAAAVRNALALVDQLPIFYVLGATLVLLTTNRQRLGDLAAGTVVIRERYAADAPDSAEELLEYATADVAFTPAQLATLAPDDRAVIRAFLQRYPDMDRAGRERLAVRMAARFHRTTGYAAARPPDDGEARAFLASLLRDLEQYRRHG
ncbi:RDD family protein [Urbifossiella limnaea]|uniref:RDD family protein n=1 Tax=Urbifossiella limnaea TaxID=2528023 RepID=A0A517XZD2_9BACT|nr:RDD family protein [Urbifossiella limnaea]QDU22872.1 RDD family protein [Urbifossiella limnaea]